MHVAVQLRYRSKSLDLADPLVMGIVNLTPDSFSDGGRFKTTSAACDHALGMLEAGAAIVDIGAESTRPGAEPVTAERQLARLLPLLEALRPQTDACISVDTGDADVIGAVADAGADLINDVFALRQPGSLEAAARTDLGVCLMHMRGTPADMQDDPQYEDVGTDVLAFLRSRANACVDAGIDRSRIAVDPGFGFGKSNDHNLSLLDQLGRFRELGLPVLVGLSRKGTLGAVTGRPVGERGAAGVAAAVLAVERGARIVRTHDVPETVDALKIIAAMYRAREGLGVGPAG